MIRSNLIGADELAGLLATAKPPTLLDVRWALTGPTGVEAYRDGHIPGAVYVDLETELAAPADAATGRHPLPTVDGLQAAARTWGVRNDRPVVVYDATGGMSAARAWWLLRWGGLADVRLLDGGLAAWTDAGGSLTTGEALAERGDVTLTGGGMPVLTAAAAAAEFPYSGVLLDARSSERFLGEVEPVDPVAGHIPGAVSAPTTENLDESGRFLAARQLRERFEALGVGDDRPVAVYCGSGVTAAHEILALNTVGIPAALYAGSWSHWIGDPNRPVAVGE